MTLTTLRYQLDVSWALLSMHLDGLTDDMCFWEPAPGSWTVRRDGDRWTADLVLPEPDPPPVPSIGWVTWHIGWWWTGAWAHTFGERRGEKLDMLAHAKGVSWPGSASAAATWLGQLKDQWVASMETVSERDLAQPVAWFEQPLSHVLAWANIELMKNAAEIGQLKLLYRAGQRGG